MPEEMLAEFDKCRACGSTRRLMESLLGEENEGVTPCLLLMSSIAAGPRAPVLIGQVVPVGVAVVDACLDCGTIYATRLIKSEAIAGMGPPEVPRPGITPMKGS